MSWSRFFFFGATDDSFPHPSSIFEDVEQGVCVSPVAYYSRGVAPVEVAALTVFIAAALLEEESDRTAHTRR